MPAANVIQLRQLLLEKFPRLRPRTKPSGGEPGPCWPTGLLQIDQACGGFPNGAMTEIVAGEKHGGSATLMRALLYRAAIENRIITLIDGGDTFDVAAIHPAVLARMLWIRCRSAEETLKAADLILRDNNLPLIFLDLVSNAPAQLRKISPTVWYRFQRLLEPTSTICAVFTPRPMINPAVARITLNSRLSLDALEMDSAQSLSRINFSVSSTQQLRKTNRQHLAG
jgi:hypothetical protein